MKLLRAGRWGAGALSVSLTCVIALLARAHGDELFDAKTKQADSLVANIDALTSEIESMRAEAAQHGKALRASCIDSKAKSARDNRAAARNIRKGWDAAAESPEYRERTLDRLVRLQVYALVFQNEALACADDEAVLKAIARQRDEARDGAPNVVSDFAPAPPHLERPPLASPF